MISIPAPGLTQQSDIAALVTISSIMAPGFLENDGSALRMRAAGDAADDMPRIQASRQFRVLLGTLRTWWPDAGELEEERLSDALSWGARDEETGRQVVRVNAATIRTRFGGDLEAFSASAAEASARHERLEEALWTMGVSNRMSGEYYSILDLARKEFGGPSGVSEHLALSGKEQARLTKSANNLLPSDGGRHGGVGTDHNSSAIVWRLEEMRDFSARLLRAWIEHRPG